MSHDTTKVLMGATGSNIKEVTNRAGTIAAGIAVRLKSDDTISTAKADGNLLGISIGKSLSDTARTAVCRKGVRVPVQLKDGFDPTIGAVVSIDDATGLATGDGSKTAVNAVYVSGRIGGTGVNGGIQEDGTTVGVAYIDFPGGL